VSNELETDGYVIVDDIAGADAFDVLRAAATALEEMAAQRRRSGDGFVLEAADVGGWVAWQQGIRPTTGLLRSVDGAHRHRPELMDVGKLLATTRVAAAAGAEVDLVNSFLWAKPAKVGSEKPWHQDMAFAPAGFHDRYANVLTAWIAIDPATVDNGCLQFVPGSHRLGVLPHIGDLEHEDAQPRRTAAVEPHLDPRTLAILPAPVHAPLPPGSAAVFDGYLVHRSAPNTSTAPRRAISFVFGVPRT
jgi:ectoine hydroxylase-related dioxygenase (phytanoyl-CoA dioxygenase family)